MVQNLYLDNFYLYKKKLIQIEKLVDDFLKMISNQYTPHSDGRSKAIKALVSQ